MDNVAAVDTSAAVTAKSGTLGTMTVLNASNVMTSGTLNVTQGLVAGEASTSHSVAGLTLAQIADNFNDAKTYSSSTPTNWSADGITATLNSAGTVLTFSQASGDAGTAAVSSSPTSAPIIVTPVIATGATLGALSVNQKADTLGGSLNLTNGITGAASTLALGTAGATDTLANLAATINSGGYGITATANTAGTQLTFTQTSGSDTAAVGSLDSVLNSDYSGVVGFFQNTNGWGQTFSTMLTNSGTSSATGILALASSSNSNIESTLNADVSKEQSLISAQQSRLTTELNSANEIMQQLPTELDGVNELYSAITGYNENAGG
ncbi:MAG: hypothetical protein ABSF53_15575 [Terracidiphilus sp.]